MATDQPWKDEGMTKAEWLAREVAKAVNAGKQWDLETVDFSDPNRPLTCLEVDFPIIPINQIAAIEGNAGKPIYQVSKWWARRRSSVFRSLLLSAAMKAPADPILKCSPPSDPMPTSTSTKISDSMARNSGAPTAPPAEPSSSTTFDPDPEGPIRTTSPS